MSGEQDDNLPDTDEARDDPLLAAEWSLGLLEGEDLIAARGKQASDPDFAWRKEWWDNWFAPLADEIPPAEPSAQVWERIASAIAQPEPRSAEVVALKARLKTWQMVSAVTSAAAAIAVMISVFSPTTTSVAPSEPVVAAAPAPLVAALPIEGTALRLDVTFIPESDQLLVAAIGLSADNVHDHELWLLPADGGDVQSLGIITPGKVQRSSLSAQITRNLAAGAQVLLTREPLGGKPADASPGPVVAKGAFSSV